MGGGRVAGGWSPRAAVNPWGIKGSFPARVVAAEDQALWHASMCTHARCRAHLRDVVKVLHERAEGVAVSLGVCVNVCVHVVGRRKREREHSTETD